MNNPQIKILPQINPLSPSKMNKKAYEFSFAWIFAIIIGAVIIFVAIYASTQLIDTSRFLGDTETAKQIGTLLSPLETTLESGKTSIIRTQAETRIFNECVSSRGTFGSQDISVSTSSGVGDVWPKTPGATSSFHNKYMFSSEIVQGEEFYAFSTPFKFPFKIADIIILWSEKESYCFVTDYDDDAFLELSNSNQRNVLNVTSPSDCPAGSISVCFKGSGCDIAVSKASRTITKNGETLHYEKSFSKGTEYSLLYAAIFSPKEIYECQVKRLMNRASEISLLYNEKSSFLSPKGCGSARVQPLLLEYSNLASSITSSQDLKTIINPVTSNLNNENARLQCKLF